MERKLRLFVCLLVGCVPAGAQGAASGVITACVGKIGGFTRIVTATKDCDARLERVVQFNQSGVAGPIGPQGPQGPQGPAGPQGASSPVLVRTIVVPASADSATNGQRLLDAIALAASVATATQPYLIQLDAGTYDVGMGAVIVPYISLRGAGSISTTVTSNSITLLFQNPGIVGATFSVSEMTVNGVLRTIAAQSVRNAVLDRLHLTGAGVEMEAVIPNASVSLLNSVVESYVLFSNNSRDPGIRFRIVGSQVNQFSTNVTPSSQGCFASFNADLVPYSPNCQ